LSRCDGELDSKPHRLEAEGRARAAGVLNSAFERSSAVDGTHPSVEAAAFNHNAHPFKDSPDVCTSPKNVVWRVKNSSLTTGVILPAKEVREPALELPHNRGSHEAAGRCGRNNG